MARKQSLATIQAAQGELLPPAVAERCEERLRVARTHMAAGCYHWIQAGMQFEAIKDDVRGHWAAWCRENKVSTATADALVRIAQSFTSPLVSDTSEDPVQIDFRALHFLSRPGIPVEVRQDAVAKAEAGEHITLEEAERLVVERVNAIMAERQRLHEEHVAAEVEAATEEAGDQLASANAALSKTQHALALRTQELAALKAPPPEPTVADAIALMCKLTGAKKLSARQVKSLAVALGKPITYGNTTYAAATPEESSVALKQAVDADALMRALQFFHTASAPAEFCAAVPDVVRAAAADLLPKVRAWLDAFEAALGMAA